MSNYNPILLRKLADQLNAQAKTAVIGGIIAGAITGSLFGYAAMLIFMASRSLIVPGLVVGIVIGAVTGRQKAQALRLQAQMAFCQIQIEENGRPDKPA